MAEQLTDVADASQLITLEKVQIKIDQMLLENEKLVKHLSFALAKTMSEGIR